MNRNEGVSLTDITTLLSKSLLRIDEVAILLEVTPRTIHRYLEEGKLTPVLDPGGRKRVRTEEIMRYL